MPQATWTERLDSIIASLFPRWGERRALARVRRDTINGLAGYRGGRHSRLDRPAAFGGRADYHLDVTYHRRDMVDRARQLERDSVLAEGLLSRSVENVVGCGFRLQAKTSNTRWNERVERLWSDWCDNEADVRGMSTFNELLALVQRSKLRDGDVGAILLADGSIQTFESDQLSSPSGEQARKNLVDGIRLDRRGRPTSFLIVNDPDPIWTSVRYQPHIEVPAEQVAFLARRSRLGQTRGLSAFSTISWLLDQFDGNVEAVTAAARMSACFGLVLKKAAPLSGLDTTTNTSDGASRRKMVLEPGAMLELETNDDVQQLNPGQPSTNFAEFLATLARLAGLAFGLPLELGMMDYSRTNYSSSRGALLAAWQVWRCEQRDLQRWITRIYRWKVLNWIREGRLPAREDAFSASFRGPGWQWIDPEKDIKASLAAIDAGFESRAGVVQRMGGDPEELDLQRKREMDRAEELGLPVVRSTLTRDPTPEKAEAPAEAGPDPLDQVKAQMDAYGIGVRSGAITPAAVDEDHFRAELGLPAVTPDITDAWDGEPVRRPVTLASPADAAQAADPDARPDPGGAGGDQVPSGDEGEDQEAVPNQA